MVWMFSNLELVVSVCTPVESSKVFAPPFPSTVSASPSVVKFILNVSSPLPPVSVSVPAPPEII